METSKKAAGRNNIKTRLTLLGVHLEPQLAVAGRLRPLRARGEGVSTCAVDLFNLHRRVKGMAETNESIK